MPLRWEHRPCLFLATCLPFPVAASTLVYFSPLFDRGLLDESPSPLNYFRQPLLDKSLTLLYTTRVGSRAPTAVITTPITQPLSKFNLKPIRPPSFLRFTSGELTRRLVHVQYFPAFPVITLPVPARELIGSVGFSV